MGSLYVGDTIPDTITVGDTPQDAVYLGAEQVWPPPVAPTYDFSFIVTANRTSTSGVLDGTTWQAFEADVSPDDLVELYVDDVLIGTTYYVVSRGSNAAALPGAVTVRTTDAFQVNQDDLDGNNVLGQWAAVPVGATVGVLVVGTYP